MQRSTRSRVALNHPPAFVPTFIVHKKLRFQADQEYTQASPLVLSIKSFGDLWCSAATATSAYQLASHVRLKKIEMWGPMASDLVPVTVQVDWTGSSSLGGFGKSNRVSDTSMGSTEPAHLASAPPPMAQISQWTQCSSTNEVCRLVFPDNAVIDVTLDLVIRDDASTQTVTGAVVGAAVGANYVRSLDSVSGTNNVRPTSLATI